MGDYQDECWQSQVAFAKPSVCDHIAFACGFIETGLPQCPAEKKARKPVGVVQWDIFSGPV
jgi:hypothetical protein